MIATEILIIYRMIGMKNKYSIYIERLVFEYPDLKWKLNVIGEFWEFQRDHGVWVRPSDLSVSRSS